MDILLTIGIGTVFIGLAYRHYLNIKNSKFICNEWKQNKIIDDFLNSSDKLDFLTTLSSKYHNECIFKLSFHTKYLAELLNIPVYRLYESKYILAIKRYYSIKAEEVELALYEKFKKKHKTILEENMKLIDRE